MNELMYGEDYNSGLSDNWWSDAVNKGIDYLTGKGAEELDKLTGTDIASQLAKPIADELVQDLIGGDSKQQQMDNAKALAKQGLKVFKDKSCENLSASEKQSLLTQMEYYASIFASFGMGDEFNKIVQELQIPVACVVDIPAKEEPAWKKFLLPSGVGATTGVAMYVWKKSILASLGTALLTGGATYYFTNKDKEAV